MTVAISFDRKAVEITWDTDVVKGDTAEIRAVSADDVSTRNVDNDGRATVTYPYAYSGSSEITVTGSEGGEDTGTITV